MVHMVRNRSRTSYIGGKVSGKVLTLYPSTVGVSNVRTRKTWTA